MFANYKDIIFRANTHNLWINAINTKNGTANLMSTSNKKWLTHVKVSHFAYKYIVIILFHNIF